MFRVEVLATGIKIESSNQRGPIKGSRIAKINRSRTHGCNLTFDPLKIKCSRASKRNNQAIFVDQKLDPGCKHLNRQHASDYPLVLHCNKLSVLIGNRLAHKLGTILTTIFKY